MDFVHQRGAAAGLLVDGASRAQQGPGQLQEAEALYPAPWLEEAIKIAVRQNRRRWSYVSRILERWAVEGKDGETGRDSEKGADPHQFTRGKYGHLYRY